MNTPHRDDLKLWAERSATLLCTFALSACSLLNPTASVPPSFYWIDGSHSQVNGVRPDANAHTLPTLIINPPHAAAGFDSQRIIYIREAHKLEYFAHSEWVDSPARMLGALLVTAIVRTGTFGAIVLSPSSASGDQRLDIEIIRLQHNFQTQPSRAQLTLRAYLLDEATRRVLAWKEFEGEALSATETAQSGVSAANIAAQDVLDQLAQFLTINQKSYLRR
jgi:cholesterol transport system auxiliary component